MSSHQLLKESECCCLGLSKYLFLNLNTSVLRFSWYGGYYGCQEILLRGKAMPTRCFTGTCHALPSCPFGSGYAIKSELQNNVWQWPLLLGANKFNGWHLSATRKSFLLCISPFFSWGKEQRHSGEPGLTSFLADPAIQKRQYKCEISLSNLIPGWNHFFSCSATPHQRRLQLV